MTKEAYNARYESRRRSRLCVKCAVKLSADEQRVRCAGCQAKAVQYRQRPAAKLAKKRYDYERSQALYAIKVECGECVKCRQPAQRPSVLCKAHLEAMRVPAELRTIRDRSPSRAPHISLDGNLRLALAMRRLVRKGVFQSERRNGAVMFKAAVTA